MNEIRGGFSWASLLAWVALIAICIYLIYAATHNKTDNENYAKGANHNETTTTIAPVQNIYPLGFAGCTPFLRLDNPVGKVVPVKNEVKK